VINIINDIFNILEKNNVLDFEYERNEKGSFKVVKFKGQTIFLEGDHISDLYEEVLKLSMGNKTILNYIQEIDSL